jgi:hypothetical protein
MKSTIKLLPTVVVVLILVGCVTSRWEYSIRETKRLLDVSELNPAGEVGWELVSCERIPIIGCDSSVATTNWYGVLTTNWGYEYIFKRPKR